MGNVIVTVKMPASLLDDLKRSLKDGHYLDLSEQVRSIVRRKWMLYNDPAAIKSKKYQQEIISDLEKKSATIAKMKLLKELDEIRQRLQGGE